MYGAETWAVKKAQEKKLDVAEMRMLGWMNRVTKMDRIRNDRIRGTAKVGEISKQVQESWLICMGMYWEEKKKYMWAREWWWWRCRGKEREEDRSGDDRITSRTTCGRRNCQGRKRKTGLNGGISWETLTPLRSRKICGRRRLSPAGYSSVAMYECSAYKRKFTVWALAI